MNLYSNTYVCMANVSISLIIKYSQIIENSIVYPEDGLQCKKKLFKFVKKEYDESVSS